MEFGKVLRLRKSVRSFSAQKVDEEQVQQILDAAQLAPCAAGDRETTHLTVVQDSFILDELRQAAALKSSKTGELIDPFYGAQLVIFVSATDQSSDHIEFSNAACIIENMLLEATNIGLGSVYIWGCLRKLRKNEEALAKLALPEGYEILSAVAIGHSSTPLKERKLDKLFSINVV